MPGPTEHKDTLAIEILAPTPSHRGGRICDCCRCAKGYDDFDEDGFGICCDCLNSDNLLIDLDRCENLEATQK